MSSVKVFKIGIYFQQPEEWSSEVWSGLTEWKPHSINFQGQNKGSLATSAWIPSLVSMVQVSRHIPSQ